MVNSKENIFRKVLYLGPNYKKRKGGIASLLREYSRNISFFYFLPSAYFKNTKANFFLLPFVVLNYCVKLIRDKKIEIIHIHGASYGSFYRKFLFFYLGKYLLKRKIIFHLHGGKFIEFYQSSSLFIKRKIEQLISESDLIIVLSEEWVKSIQQNFNPKKIEVIPNMIAGQEPISKKVGVKVIFLFLGKICKEKGIDDLIELIKNNKEKWQDRAVFKIGGDGDTDELEKKIKKFNLSNILTYEGWVLGEKKNKLLSISHVMILPSYYEGLPISLLEGMSFSMPLIANNVGGIAQIIKNGENGVLLKPGSILELQNAIEYYINNHEKIQQHGKKSYNLVKNYFPSQIIDKLNKVYKEIL